MKASGSFLFNSRANGGFDGLSLHKPKNRKHKAKALSNKSNKYYGKENEGLLPTTLAISEKYGGSGTNNRANDNPWSVKPGGKSRPKKRASSASYSRRTKLNALSPRSIQAQNVELGGILSTDSSLSAALSKVKKRVRPLSASDVSLLSNSKSYTGGNLSPIATGSTSRLNSSDIFQSNGKHLSELSSSMLKADLEFDMEMNNFKSPPPFVATSLQKKKSNPAQSLQNTALISTPSITSSKIASTLKKLDGTPSPFSQLVRNFSPSPIQAKITAQDVEEYLTRSKANLKAYSSSSSSSSSLCITPNQGLDHGLTRQASVPSLRGTGSLEPLPDRAEVVARLTDALNEVNVAASSTATSPCSVFSISSASSLERSPIPQISGLASTKKILSPLHKANTTEEKMRVDAMDSLSFNQHVNKINGENHGDLADEEGGDPEHQEYEDNDEKEKEISEEDEQSDEDDDSYDGSMLLDDIDLCEFSDDEVENDNGVSGVSERPSFVPKLALASASEIAKADPCSINFDFPQDEHDEHCDGAGLPIPQNVEDFEALSDGAKDAFLEYDFQEQLGYWQQYYFEEHGKMPEDPAEFHYSPPDFVFEAEERAYQKHQEAVEEEKQYNQSMQAQKTPSGSSSDPTRQSRSTPSTSQAGTPKVLGLDIPSPTLLHPKQQDSPHRTMLNLKSPGSENNLDSSVVLTPHYLLDRAKNQTGKSKSDAMAAADPDYEFLDNVSRYLPESVNNFIAKEEEKKAREEAAIQEEMDKYVKRAKASETTKDEQNEDGNDENQINPKTIKSQETLADDAGANVNQDSSASSSPSPAKTLQKSASSQSISISMPTVSTLDHPSPSQVCKTNNQHYDGGKVKVDTNIQSSSSISSSPDHTEAPTPTFSEADLPPPMSPSQIPADKPMDDIFREMVSKEKAISHILTLSQNTEKEEKKIIHESMEHARQNLQVKKEKEPAYMRDPSNPFLQHASTLSQLDAQNAPAPKKYHSKALRRLMGDTYQSSLRPSYSKSLVLGLKRERKEVRKLRKRLRRAEEKEKKKQLKAKRKKNRKIRRKKKIIARSHEPSYRKKESEWLGVTDNPDGRGLLKNSKKKKKKKKKKLTKAANPNDPFYHFSKSSFKRNGVLPPASNLRRMNDHSWEQDVDDFNAGSIDRPQWREVTSNIGVHNPDTPMTVEDLKAQQDLQQRNKKKKNKKNPLEVLRKLADTVHKDGYSTYKEKVLNSESHKKKIIASRPLSANDPSRVDVNQREKKHRAHINNLSVDAVYGSMKTIPVFKAESRRKRCKSAGIIRKANRSNSTPHIHTLNAHSQQKQKENGLSKQEQNENVPPHLRTAISGVDVVLTAFNNRRNHTVNIYAFNSKSKREYKVSVPEAKVRRLFSSMDPLLAKGLMQESNRKRMLEFIHPRLYFTPSKSETNGWSINLKADLAVEGLLIQAEKQFRRQQPLEDHILSSIGIL